MVTTLGQFIIERQAEFPYSKGELSRLLRDIGIAAKIVNREVNKAGLVDILGEAGETNVQGETVKKLDTFANDQFIIALSGQKLGLRISDEQGLLTNVCRRQRPLIATFLVRDERCDVLRVLRHSDRLRKKDLFF